MHVNLLIDKPNKIVIIHWVDIREEVNSTVMFQDLEITMLEDA